jgi:hypothetical protein
VTPVDTVRELLKRAPRKSLCDPCLAYGCSTSLTDMQQITARLRISHDFREGGCACARCGRLAATTIYHISKDTTPPTLAASGFGHLQAPDTTSPL